MVVYFLRRLWLAFSLVLLAQLAHAPASHAADENPDPLPWIRVAASGDHFVREGEDSPFVIWGANYDHDSDGRLLDEYWLDEWQTVVEDFEEMRAMGLNCVRVHLQVGLFMSDPTTPNPVALNQLKKLLALAERLEMYLDITGLACYHKRNIPDWYDQLDEAQRWQTQATFWSAIAQTCAHSPAVFCYDLMNEPILPGKEPSKHWLTEEGLGDKFFVQRIALDLHGRSRQQVAKAWVQTLTGAIRKHDQRHLITVGVIPWVFVFGGGKPLFYDPHVGESLDFVAVHFYPQSGKIDAAIEALQHYDIGKPLVVEEMFPLKCNASELADFIERGQSQVDGWISFYWGKTISELEAREPKTMASAITADWLNAFRKVRQQFQAGGGASRATSDKQD